VAARSTTPSCARAATRRYTRRIRSPAPTPDDVVAGVAASTSMWKKRQQQHVVPVAWSKRKARTRRPHVQSVGQRLSRKLVVVPEVATVESEEER
jgi:hypothetical protein